MSFHLGFPECSNLYPMFCHSCSKQREKSFDECNERRDTSSPFDFLTENAAYLYPIFYYFSLKQRVKSFDKHNKRRDTGSPSPCLSATECPGIYIASFTIFPRNGE